MGRQLFITGIEITETDDNNINDSAKVFINTSYIVTIKEMNEVLLDKENQIVYQYAVSLVNGNEYFVNELEIIKFLNSNL